MQILLLGGITMNTIHILVSNVVPEIGYKYCIWRTLYYENVFILFFLLTQEQRNITLLPCWKKPFVSVMKECLNFSRALENYFSGGGILQGGPNAEFHLNFRTTCYGLNLGDCIHLFKWVSDRPAVDWSANTVAFIRRQIIKFWWKYPTWKGPRWKDPRRKGPKWEDPRWKGPRWKGPRWKGPRWKGPRWKGPRGKGLRWKGPRWKGPRGKGPRWEGPRWKGPRWKGPRWKGPRWKGPRGKGPKWKDPRWKGPRWEDPRWKGLRWEDPRWKGPRWKRPKGEESKVVCEKWSKSRVFISKGMPDGSFDESALQQINTGWLSF